MKTLTIFFDGLCAFAQNTNKKEATVLLVNATNPPLGPVPPIPKHQARLYYQKADRQSDSSNDDPKHKGQCNYWRLDCEQLTLQTCDATGKCSALKFDALTVHTATIVNELPGSQEKSNFGWIPKMSDLHPTDGDLTVDVLKKEPDCPKVIARMRMTEGTLATHGFAGEPKTGEVHSYAFKDGNGNMKTQRALTELASLSIPYDDSVKIIATTFNGKKSRHVTLKSAADLVVHIRNEPQGGGPGTWRNTKTFGMVYELSKSSLSWKQRFLPEVKKGTSTPHAGPNQKPSTCGEIKTRSHSHAELCPFVQFNKHPDA